MIDYRYVQTVDRGRLTDRRLDRDFGAQANGDELAERPLTISCCRDLERDGARRRPALLREVVTWQPG
jgi:hypothetical protein